MGLIAVKEGFFFRIQINNSEGPDIYIHKKSAYAFNEN